MDESVLGNVVGSLIDKNRDNWGSNGFIWVILLLFLCGGGFGWGNRGNVATTQDVAASSQFAQIDNGIRGLAAGQASLGYDNLKQSADSNMMIAGGFANLTAALAENRFAQQNCCCETNRSIDSAKYDVTRNIDALRFDTQKQTCDITAVDTANTQKILDRLCTMEANAKDAEISRLRSDLQAAQLTLAQSSQTQTIVGALKAPAPVPAYVVANPYCNCNNGYAYNYNGGTVIA